MANMSYCRFENTSKDLGDCIDAIETMLNNSGKNEYDEPLSTSEQLYFEKMVKQCDTFSNYANTLLELVEFREHWKTYNDEMNNK
tara:strand:+ start:219 stop:473 length:255 start_codon:yes stop_codon:yes gene_type:complete